jgi:hypothetical protein
LHDDLDMSRSPIIETLAAMKVKLESAIELRRDADKQISEYSSAIRALALVCEDDEIKTTYLNLIEELGGKPGFLAAIRGILRSHPNGLTPGVIRAAIQATKLMDLSAYSNPLASIHTTLRRMAESGEVVPFHNEEGEKAYRLKGLHRVSDAVWETLGSIPSERTEPKSRMEPPPVYGSLNSSASQDARQKAVTGRTEPPPPPPRRKLKTL